ncbi:hypothetical protein AAD018_017395 [Aestuariibius insulae]|uniref:hypothetical protein n=1 Tax=Aestuariibius insulae TaxID=2058287 RepID=UPI00345EBFB3
MPRPILFASCLALAALPAIAETSKADLIGDWQTPVVEQASPDGSATAWTQATVLFAETEETLVFEIFADEERTVPLFTYRSSGPYRVADDPSPVAGAIALDLENDRSEVTLHQEIPDLVAALNMQDCPLEVGVAVEISQCVSGPPFSVGDCVDMDVVMIDEGGRRLRFGGETFDRCVTRPDELSEQAFFRMEG